jgi:hypothetical protein
MFFDFMLHLKISGHDKRTVFNFKLADWDGLRNALVNHTTFPSNQSTDINTDWERWKGLFLRVATELYFQKLPSLLKSSSKKLWALFKSTSNHSNIPAKMSWSNQDSTSSTADNPVYIADMLNRYFYSVFQTPDHTHNQLSSVDFEDNMTDLTSISDLTLTEGEVCYVLRNLDEEKATGPDKIPAVLLKN